MNQGYYNNNNNQNYNNGNYNRNPQYYNNNKQYYNPNYRYNNMPRPNGYNNQNLNNQNNNNNNKKNPLLPFFIIAGVMGFIAIVLLIIFFISVAVSGNNSDKSNDNNNNTSENANNNQQKTPTEKVVGDALFGYATIPYGWERLPAESGIKNLIGFISPDGQYVLQMLYMYQDAGNAYKYTNEYIKAKKEDEGENIKDIKAVKTTYAGKDAYQVYVETDKMITLTLAVDGDDGVSRFIAVEGPDGGNSAFRIIESFREKK